MKIVVGGTEKKQGEYSGSEIFVSYELNENDFKMSDEVLSSTFKTKVDKMLFDRYVMVIKELYKSGKINDEEMLKKISTYVKREKKASLILESKKFDEYIKKMENK